MLATRCASGGQKIVNRVAYRPARLAGAFTYLADAAEAARGAPDARRDGPRSDR
jgi:hypothetical protein